MKKEDVKNHFKQLLQPKGNKQQHKKLNHYFYLLIGAGILIMILSNIGSPFQSDGNHLAAIDSGSEAVDEEAAANPSSGPSSIVEYEKYYESQLKEILAEVIGVSNVSVKVNIASTEKKIHEKNRSNEKQVTEERDQEGGTRTIESHTIDEQVVITREGDNDKPIVIGSEKPKVTGVIVVAQGAEQMAVKQQIIEAVTRFLHVPSHQVSVLPKKIKEE